MSKLTKLLAMAIDFISYFIEKNSTRNIKSIIIFGSVARGEASHDSDIDIFVDCTENIPKADNILSDFYASKKYLDYWKLKGVENVIKLQTGKLDAWKDLKTSIISNGIIIYSKYKELPNKYSHCVLFSWENIRPESKRVLLSKRLFGFTNSSSRYEGLVKKYSAQRIGKGTILVPLEHELPFKELFKKMRVTVRIRKIIEYE